MTQLDHQYYESSDQGMLCEFIQQNDMVALKS